ncbi:MAG TPA: response regulator transcription factor [Thermoanaerobaculia bacterium]|jgi:DNA-binding NarL/FixJ family response regulator|nr:response regulator transcription factor [Thermoanaerobaculia bacterium]
MPVKLALADDHPIVLDGLAQLFRLEEEFEVVACCRDGDETLRLLREQKVDVLVLDLKMPGTDGLAVLAAIREERLAGKVLVLTAAIDDDQLARALHLGVSGVVLKEVAPQILVQAVRTVHAGGLWLDESFGRTLDRLVHRGAAAREAAKVLTRRELEIVRMAEGGLRSRSIAEKLIISEATVKIHLHNIYQKLKVNGRLELAAYARRHGLL